MKSRKTIQDTNCLITKKAIYSLIIFTAMMTIMSSTLSGCAPFTISALTESGEEGANEQAEATAEAEETEAPEAIPAPTDTEEPGAEPSAETEEDAATTPTPEYTPEISLYTSEASDQPTSPEPSEQAETSPSEATETPEAEETEVTEEVTPTPEYTQEPEASQDPEEAIEPEASQEPDATQEPEAQETCEGEEFKIVSFEYDTISLIVERSVAKDDLPLPTELTAINGEGETVTVSVTWSNGEEQDEYSSDPNSYEVGRAFGYGPWVFTAVIDEAYTYIGEDVTASVSIPECKAVSSFCGLEPGSLLMRFIVEKGEKVNLPSSLVGYMSDGGYKVIPVTWSGSYDVNTVGTYTLTMNLDGGYTGGSASIEIVVITSQE